jgi:hypothetical protein
MGGSAPVAKDGLDISTRAHSRRFDMRMKLITVLAALAVGASLGGAALAAPDDHGKAASKRAHQFHGTVASVGADDGDPLTADSFVVDVTKANGNGKRFLAGATQATFTVSDATHYYGGAASFADLAVGDPVKVKAKATNTDGSLDAKSVKEKAPEPEEEPAP